MSFLINNHLKEGYSDYNLLFLKRYHQELNLNNKILDVGFGHYRNLYLFYKVVFKNLYRLIYKILLKLLFLLFYFLKFKKYITNFI